MECLTDARDCLNVAESMLSEIKKIYDKSLLTDKPPGSLKVTIKNFLENARSALEYPTFYVFNTYCATNYTEKELENKRNKIYFPIRKTKSTFDTCINKDFRGLQVSKPEIYDAFEKCQVFKGQKWTQHLNELCNRNKHVKLTKQQRNKTISLNGQDIFGNTFTNVVINNCGTGIAYGDKHDFDIHPFFNNFNMQMEITYQFEDINEPVLPTLNNIYLGVSSVISQLESVL
jgi:hypothetical protein